MPNIDASDYTKYLKYQAAQLAYANNAVPRPIQTVDQVAPTISVVNSYLKTSQAAFLTKAANTNLGSNLNYVRAMPPNNVNHPAAKSTLTWASTTMGTSSSKFQQPGGLPAKNVVGTYTRLPQLAGWATGSSTQTTSSALR
jgi:hypothetical protein